MKDMGASIPSSPWWAAIALFMFVLLVWQSLALVMRKKSRRDRIVGRVMRAVEGEQAAGVFLHELGYDLLGSQVGAEYMVLMDGEERTIGIRADFLVEREGRRYVAEVKTGAVATKIETAGTRRQLLEYLVAFDVHGILLVDMDARRIHAVTFPSLFVGNRESESSFSPLPWIAAAACAVTAIWMLFVR